MAGRPKGSGKGAVMGEAHRDKIRKSNVLSRLIRHAEGMEPDMTSSEVQAASTLLGYAFPKMQPIDPDTGKAGLTVHIGTGVRDL